MKEYEDEEIGDLEDYADDESMDGRVDIYDDAAFNDALDDFLATQGDLNDESIRSKPTKPSAAKASDASAADAASGQEARGKKKDYSILLADPAAAAGGDVKGAEEEPEDEEPLQDELTPAQRAALEAEEAEEAEEIVASHEYLGAERPKLEWDCETILSTYSVLDNHPTMIKLPSKKKSGRANGATKATNGASSAAAATQMAKGSVTVAPQRIILSTAGLPTEFLPERQAAKAHSGISLSEVTPVTTDKPVVDTSGGRRGETKEERKERKAKIKQEQKVRVLLVLLSADEVHFDLPHGIVMCRLCWETGAARAQEDHEGGVQAGRAATAATTGERFHNTRERASASVCVRACVRACAYVYLHGEPSSSSDSQRGGILREQFWFHITSLALINHRLFLRRPSSRESSPHLFCEWVALNSICP